MAEAQRLDPAAFIHPGTDPIAAADLEAAQRFGSATLHEAAGRIGALPSAIKPVVPGFAIAGQAVPVASRPRTTCGSTARWPLPERATCWWST